MHGMVVCFQLRLGKGYIAFCIREGYFQDLVEPQHSHSFFDILAA